MPAPVSVITIGLDFSPWRNPSGSVELSASSSPVNSADGSGFPARRNYPIPVLTGRVDQLNGTEKLQAEVGHEDRGTRRPIEGLIPLSYGHRAEVPLVAGTPQSSCCLGAFVRDKQTLRTAPCGRILSVPCVAISVPGPRRDAGHLPSGAPPVRSSASLNLSAGAATGRSVKRETMDCA